MAMFGKKKEPETKGLLGVDVGAGGMKVVELVPEKGRLMLGSYAYSQLKAPREKRTAPLDDPKQAAKMLTRIVKKADMKSTRVNASLPSHSVFHAIITIPQPKDEKEDLQPMIKAQVKKLLPMPVEEMILDTTVIDKHLLPKKVQEPKGKKKSKTKQPAALTKNTKPRKNLRVLVSGAPKVLVNQYVELFKQAKLQLVSLETEAFALIRSLIGKDKARMMIVDIGYERTNITLVHEGIPFLHRSIKAGGSTVTTMMSKQMGISMVEAEQMKLDMAQSGEGELPPVLKEAMMPILHEVKYSLDLYAQQEFHDHATVEKIIVTGGSARLPQIDTFLKETLNINVYLGDPWARIAAPSGLRPVLDELGPRFSVAIGLAMKEDKR